MMKPEVIKMEGEKRGTGKKSARQLREELRVPSVLYGPKVDENVHFSVNELELDKILSFSQTSIQELTVDDVTYKTILKRVEFDPITDRAIHADFYVLADDHPVTLRVPVRIKGVAVGVRDGGGRVYQPMRIIRIKSMPDMIPAQVEIDISDMEIGDSVHVSDLELDGVTMLDEGSRSIVNIIPPKSEELFTTSIEPEIEEEELLEGEEVELEEGEELPEGEEAEAAEEEAEEEDKS